MKAVILAGGTGTRLWPLSRIQKPKQFQKLASGHTLLQETLKRLDFLKPEDLYIATNREFLELIKEQAPHVPEEQLILEPALRDTASCIGWAAAVIAKQHPNEVMAIIYADHLIQNQEEFKQKLKVAEKIAHEEKTLNIIEVKAKTPNVNLGYVKIGAKLSTVDGVDVHAFERFTEKPDQETAEQFIKDGHYLWNTGIYVWRVDVILEAYAQHLPKTYKQLMRMQAALGTPEEKAVIANEYPKLEKISIDYAIMEKVAPSQVRIIPAELGWSDIGTWFSLHDELAHDPSDNLTHGESLVVDTFGSVIHNHEDNKLIAALGLHDIAIINTKDALLVCPKNRSHEVKRIVEALRKSGREDLL